CTVALAWIALRWRLLAHRRLVVALLVFAASSLLLALGSYGGIYPWLAQVPGLDAFRAPTRHIMLFHFALSGIAAVVLEDLVAMSRRGEVIAFPTFWPLVIPVVLSIATTGSAAVVAQSAWATSPWAVAHGVNGLNNLRGAAPWSCLVVVQALLLV